LKNLQPTWHRTWIFLGIPLLLLVLLQLIGFDGLYGQDSYEYLRYTKAIQQYIKNGVHPESFYWPVLDPFIASLLGFIFTNAVVGLQFLTCISISICCIYLFKILKLLYPEHTNFSFYYILIFGLLSPYFLKSGVVVMSDMMAAMFIVLTFYYFLKSLYKHTSFALVFLYATCALMTRYASLVITLPIVLSALYFVIKRRAVKGFLIGIILSTIACVPFVILQWENLFGGTSNYFLNSWSPIYYLKSSYTTIDGIQSYRFPNVLFVLYVFVHPGFIFIGLLLAFVKLKMLQNPFSTAQKFFAISIGLYLLFLAGIPFQNKRVLGLIFPMVLLFFYPGFKQLIKREQIQKHLKFLAIFCILLQLSLWFFTFKNVYTRTLFEKQLTITIAPYQGNTLYGFDYDIAIQGRGLIFNYKNMYEAIYDDFKSNDLILFSPSLIVKQWDGKNPMKNWNRIEQSYQLKILETFKDGWHLYQIVAKK